MPRRSLTSVTLTTFLLAALLGYLIGSLSFARIVGRWVAPGEDLSTTHLQMGPDEEPMVVTGVSGTAIAARAGPRWGCLTSLADIAKAFLATLIATWIWPETDARFVAAAAAVWGHVLPIYHGFKGGGGLSTAIGGLLALDWIGVPATTVGAVVLGVALGDGLLAYASGPLLVIGWALWRGDTAFLLYAVAVNAIYWWALRPELQQHYRRLAGKSISERRRELISGMRESGGQAPWAQQPDDDTG